MTADPKRDFVNDLTDALVALNNDRPTLPSWARIAQMVHAKLDTHLDVMVKEAAFGIEWHIVPNPISIRDDRNDPGAMAPNRTNAGLMSRQQFDERIARAQALLGIPEAPQ